MAQVCGKVSIKLSVHACVPLEEEALTPACQFTHTPAHKNACGDMYICASAHVLRCGVRAARERSAPGGGGQSTRGAGGVPGRAAAGPQDRQQVRLRVTFLLFVYTYTCMNYDSCID
jgi:hypothetical protein